MNTNIFKAEFQPEQVRGHQLERLRLRLLQLSSKPVRPFCRWDGKRLQVGMQSTHRTLGGRHINMIARIKRYIHPAPPPPDYFDDRDEDFNELVCERCHGDTRDPWCDYLLPCPLCQGEQH